MPTMMEDAMRISGVRPPRVSSAGGRCGWPDLAAAEAACVRSCRSARHSFLICRGKQHGTKQGVSTCSEKAVLSGMRHST